MKEEGYILRTTKYYLARLYTTRQAKNGWKGDVCAGGQSVGMRDFLGAGAEASKNPSTAKKQGHVQALQIRT